METRQAALYKLDGINQLLDAVFEPDTRLSGLLADQGLSPDQIEALKRQHLVQVVTGIAEAWCGCLAEELPERHAEVVCRRYRLSCVEEPTLAGLGDQLGLSRERIRQLQVSGVKRLRNARRRARLVELAVEVARKVTLS